MAFSWWCWCCCVLLFGGSSASAPVANIPGLGCAKGIISNQSNSVWMFLGLPYARPPTGNLRWQPAQPPQPWGCNQTKDASRFGNRCMQPDTLAPKTSPMAEDCLFLVGYLFGRFVSVKLSIFELFVALLEYCSPRCSGGKSSKIVSNCFTSCHAVDSWGWANGSVDTFRAGVSKMFRGCHRLIYCGTCRVVTFLASRMMSQ